jgi:hypothetical protein
MAACQQLLGLPSRQSAGRHQFRSQRLGFRRIGFEACAHFSKLPGRQ